MEARILGALSLVSDGAELVPAVRKQRQLLSLLLVNANRVTPVDYLIRALWDGRPPTTALATLQTYVLRLRRRFDEVLGDRRGKDVLATRDGAYLFAVDDARFDLHAYRRASREGFQALEAGDNEQAASLLRTALDLWRGEALADVRPTLVLESVVRELHESRTRVLQQWLEAQLRLSRFQECLDELAVLCQRHRFNENLHRQYMIALYQTDQRLRALEVFRRLRERLVDSTGLEPNDSLSRMHEQILHGRPLRQVATGSVPTPRAPSVGVKPFAYSSIATVDYAW